MSLKRGHHAYLLELDPERVRWLYARGGIETKGDAVEQLARALAASAPLETDRPWALVVRKGSPGVVGAVGEFEAGSVPRLEAIRWQVEGSLDRLRYVDEEAVLAACQTLAQELRRTLGESGLREARFSAIPRGGYIVLGYLAYALNLRRDQLSGPDGQRPWVVVDDCCISGLRFREILDRAERSDVVFAHLFSHPHLRAAIEADRRVRRCLAADDLSDHAPEVLGDGYVAWRERWESRQPGQHYWLGKTDHVCFPWSEPDVGIWNSVLEREDPGWCVVPPSHCLRNRVRFAESLTDLQVLESPGPIRPARGVIHARLTDDVVVARIGSEKAWKLSGTGADMWESLSRHGTISAAGEALARAYDVPRERLLSDLADLAESLHGEALLEVPSQTGTSGP